jgi:hypothetical protein
MNKLNLILTAILFANISFGQWTPLKQPQSNALGRILKDKTLTDNPVDKKHIRTEEGEAEKTSLIKSSFNSDFGAGTFSSHKYDSVVVKNVEVDYIDETFINDNGAFKNSFFVYKGLRASEVTVYFTRDIDAELKAKEILEAALKANILKYIPNRDSISFSYSNNRTTAMTIKNPRVYFQVQVVKLKKVETRGRRRSFSMAFNEQNNPKFSLDFANSDRRKAINYPIIKGVSTQPFIELALQKDTDNKLQLVLLLDDQFAKANNLPNPYPISEKPIGGGIITYFESGKYLGKLANDNIDGHVYLFVDGEKKSENVVEFKNFQTGGGNDIVLTTCLYSPYIKFKRYNGQIK